MAKRLRLLVYEGPADLIERQRHNEGRNSGPSNRRIFMMNGQDLEITSVELDPTRMTIREVLRVLFGKEAK